MSAGRSMSQHPWSLDTAIGGEEYVDRNSRRVGTFWRIVRIEMPVIPLSTVQKERAVLAGNRCGRRWMTGATATLLERAHFHNDHIQFLLLRIPIRCGLVARM